MTPAVDSLDRTRLTALQEQRFRALLAVVPQNLFLARKFAAAGLDPRQLTLADLPRLPFTTKTELLADQQEHPPYGSGLTYPRADYCRLHQTSGTTGRALRWLDTPASWEALLGCWETLFRIAGIGRGDRLFFPFSFGPFLGFWTAFHAAGRLGLLALPGGGMSSTARLRFLLDHEATVVCCTPTYALRLAEVAAAEGIELAAAAVRLVIVAGEPGGSIPATRSRIEQAWGARVLDHNGLTEVGPTGIECLPQPAGLHLLESDYLVEVIDPATGAARPPGEAGELILTNLGRLGSPVVRYRTGDLVCAAAQPCPCGLTFVRLEGGILGRTDDMILLRGNNLYPAALEAVIHRFADVAEYRVIVDQSAALAELRIEIEPCAGSDPASLAERVSRAIRDAFWFRAEVITVAQGALPRFDMKARRIVRKNHPSPPGGEGRG